MQKGILALFLDRMQAEYAENFGRVSFISFSLFQIKGVKTKDLTSKIAFLFLFFLLQVKEYLKPEVYMSLGKGQPSDTPWKPVLA